MPQNNSQIPSSKKIRIITNVLTTAIKVWLRTQVSKVSQLEVEIRASDRQLLSGFIPWVSIFATHAVYRDLHLTQVQLIAENIRINIGSVLKGQPLRLLETVPVVGDLIQEQEDLNASLSSALLSTALNDVLLQLIPEYRPKSKSMSWEKINLNNSGAVLYATFSEERELTHLEINMGLELLSAHELRLKPIQVQSNTAALLEGIHHELYFDLGLEVDIQELTLMPGKLVCRGRINVNP